jgi:pyruvate dehydrogenase E2 component (dihydrolipoamide acetyltransferase)
MATPIEMPKLGNEVEECLLARWRTQPGETVSAGDVLADIETAKASFELTAPADGTLLAVFFGDGDLVPVFTTVGVVGSPGEPIDQFRRQAPGNAPEPPADTPAASSRPSVPEGASAPAASAPAMSPRARRFADDHGFFPSAVAGSGPGGRILEEDLKQLYYRARQPSPATDGMVDDGSARRGQGSAATGSGRVSDPAARPVSPSLLRSTIARRMRNSLTSTAQYTLNTSAVAAGLLSLRARVKSTGSAENASAVNINAMVLFCAIKALEAVPEVNVEFLDGTIYQHSSIHIGFACDTPRGLLVPVIRDSQRLTLPQLAAEIKSLTARAIEGSLAPDDLTGGTFTVSNLGTYGIESFSPILNPPQVAILGVNAIQLKPVRRDRAVEFVDYIGLSLTCDHQVIDGAPAARFLRTVREQIEQIESLGAPDLQGQDSQEGVPISN